MSLQDHYAHLGHHTLFLFVKWDGEASSQLSSSCTDYIHFCSPAVLVGLQNRMIVLFMISLFLYIYVDRKHKSAVKCSHL